MPELSEGIVAAYGIGLIVIFIIIKIFYTPIKFMIKVMINSVFGGIILFVLNLVGNSFGMSIGINAFTALITGMLGAPGLSMLLLLQIVLNA